MSKSYRSQMSAEALREIQERRRSGATRFSRRQPRRTAKAQAIRESSQS